MKKVLITGGAGFIGYHLAKRLASHGYDVTIVDNFFRGRRDADLEALVTAPNVRLVEMDLTALSSWDKLGGGFEYVYHLVGINGTRLFYEIPHEVLRIGVSTTMNALEWFRTINGVPDAKILYTSSSEAYAGALEAFGNLPIPTGEDVPLVIADTYNPRWSYGGQKIIGELFFIHCAKAYGFRMTIVRPHNFYGPREGYDHVIPEVLGRIAARQDPFPILGSHETRSFCYIDDAVTAIHMTMESSQTDFGTYNIGSANEIVIRDLVQKIFSIAGWKPNMIEEKEAPHGSVKRRVPDIAKIKKDTSWEEVTTLEDGLRKTMDWYSHNPKPIGL